MSYTYGMKGAPAVGNGLGGLPRKQAALGLQSTYTRIVTAGSGVIVPPANAKFMRVAVIGGGGYGNNNNSGGGCAATKITAAAPINYVVGAGGTSVTLVGGTSSADLPGYLLLATGGSAVGGTGSGGDYNYSGGTGAGGGGGAAGPFGNGANGATIPSAGALNNGADSLLGVNGWGVQGGGGGGSIQNNSNLRASAGGGGAGASAGSCGAGLTATTPGPKGGNSGLWGGAGLDSAYGVSGNGGEMGGGGGRAFNGTSNFYGNGGVGGIVVEWFYD
jgi:hypothetical protein